MLLFIGVGIGLLIKKFLDHHLIVDVHSLYKIGEAIKQLISGEGGAGK